MICEECKKRNATVYINQILDDKVKQTALCDDCAAAHVGSEQSQSITSEPRAKEANYARCPACHTTLSSFENSKNLILGCPKCYEYFEKEIMRKLSFKRGRLIYGARVPLRLRQEAKRSEYLKKLRAEMSDAVANEDFERALTLREMIKCVG